MCLCLTYARNTEESKVVGDRGGIEALFIVLEDEDTDIALHFGSLSSLSDNIYLDIRFWLETKDGSGFDGIYDENYYYGFDIGIKGFFIPN